MKFSFNQQNKLICQEMIALLSREQDLTILTSLVKAITTAIYSQPDIIEAYLTLDKFLLPLSKQCLQKFQIRELDFGNFKDKRDDAKVPSIPLSHPTRT